MPPLRAYWISAVTTESSRTLCPPPTLGGFHAPPHSPGPPSSRRARPGGELNAGPPRPPRDITRPMRIRVPRRRPRRAHFRDPGEEGVSGRFRGAMGPVRCRSSSPGRALGVLTPSVRTARSAAAASWSSSSERVRGARLNRGACEHRSDPCSRKGISVDPPSRLRSSLSCVRRSLARRAC
jgi:hypothetical protein